MKLLLLRARAGFTLIELLVVISIIALLAGIATPVYQSVLLDARMTGALNKARQVGTALHLFANDHGGLFPGGGREGDEMNTSNDAYRTLIPAYLSTESIFVVPGSRMGAAADERVNTASAVLQPGENHWAYVKGLTQTSDAGWPLVVDHTDGSGRFTTKEGELGGTWRGKKAIVVRVDASALKAPLSGAAEERFLPRPDEPTANALQPGYMGSAVRLLEPAQ